MRRGPLTANAIESSLSRDALEGVGTIADSLEDETLALAVVAECGRRRDHDEIETGETDAEVAS